jgi:hypothetical protein
VSLAPYGIEAQADDSSTHVRDESCLGPASQDEANESWGGDQGVKVCIRSLCASAIE